jgi:hypothetical protein
VTGVLCAAMILTHPDAVVISLVLVLAIPAVRRRWALVGAVAVLAALPWYLFSWIGLGAVLPDSLIIKMIGHSWHGNVFGNGLYLYFKRWPAAITISLAAAVLGLCWAVPALARRDAPAPWRRPLLALGLAAVAHFATLALAAPAPFHWYYGPSVGLATVMFGGLCSRPLAAPIRAGLSAALLCCFAAGLAFDLAWGMPWRAAPVSTNWATSAEYMKIGEQLGPDLKGAAVRSPGEVGELAYFCNCDIVDAFADRGRFMVKLANLERRGGALRHLFVRFDYLFADRHQRPQRAPYDLNVVVQSRPGVPHWIIGTPWTEAGRGGRHVLELVRVQGN